MGIDPYSPTTVVCLTTITLEAVSGIVLNLFLLFVIQQNLHRAKSTSSGDSVHVAMIRSSIFLTLVLVVSLFCSIFSAKVLKTVHILFNVLTVYCLSSSLYFTTIFCFFLFIRVVQPKSGVLAWMKRNIPLVLPRLLVAVEVFSFCCSCLTFLFFSADGELYRNSSSASTGDVVKGQNLGGHVSFLTLAVVLVPYFLMAMTIILAAGSLILHKMKVMKSTGPTVNTDIYKNTVYKMMRFFTFHTLFCCVLYLADFAGLANGGPGHWTALIIMFLLSPANSLIIMYSNTKLKNSWKKMIGGIVRCQLFIRDENS